MGFKTLKDKHSKDSFTALGVIAAFILFFVCIFVTLSCLPVGQDDTSPVISPGIGGSTTKEGPINAGQSFIMTLGAYTGYTLEDVEIMIDLPPEIIIEEGNPVWKGRVKAGTWYSSKQKTLFDLVLQSKTDWTKWSRPVKVYISFQAIASGRYQRWTGHYRKTVTWSHEGFNDPIWGEETRETTGESK